MMMLLATRTALSSVSSTSRRLRRTVGARCYERCEATSVAKPAWSPSPSFVSCYRDRVRGFRGRLPFRACVIARSASRELRRTVPRRSCAAAALADDERVERVARRTTWNCRSGNRAVRSEPFHSHPPIARRQPQVLMRIGMNSMSVFPVIAAGR